MRNEQDLVIEIGMFLEKITCLGVNAPCHEIEGRIWKLQAKVGVGRNAMTLVKGTDECDPNVFGPRAATSWEARKTPNFGTHLGLDETEHLLLS